jgi:hypothetical protein
MVTSNMRLSIVLAGVAIRFDSVELCFEPLALDKYIDVQLLPTSQHTACVDRLGMLCACAPVSCAALLIVFGGFSGMGGWSRWQVWWHRWIPVSGIARYVCAVPCVRV